MAAKNDITGDSIISKVNSPAFESGWENIFGKKPEGAMSVSEGEKLGLSDKPQDGDQRLNNVGLLEVYYGGEWNVKETG